MCSSPTTSGPKESSSSCAVDGATQPRDTNAHLPPRPPEFRRYRLAVYAVFALVCAVAFSQLIRGVVVDLYGQPAPAAGPVSSPTVCLDELDGLYQQLAARAVEPAPRGLNESALSTEWDLWSRRWEADLETVSQSCRLSNPSDATMSDLADAQEALVDLRRDLGRSGDGISAEAGRAKDALASARGRLFNKKP